MGFVSDCRRHFSTITASMRRLGNTRDKPQTVKTRGDGERSAELKRVANTWKSVSQSIDRNISAGRWNKSVTMSGIVKSRQLWESLRFEDPKEGSEKCFAASWRNGPDDAWKSRETLALEISDRSDSSHNPTCADTTSAINNYSTGRELVSVTR